MSDGSPAPSTPAAEPDAPRRGVTRSRAIGIIGASGIAAISAFIIQWLVVRWSSATFADEFLAFWGLLFGVFGVISGMQNETTRAVGSAELGRRDGARAMTAALVLGGITAVAVVLSSPLWASRVVPHSALWAVPLVAVGVVLYACHATLSGSLAGRGNWGLFSGLMAAESAGRLVLWAVAMAAVALIGPVELAIAAPAGIWLLFVLLSPAARSAAGARTDVPLPRLLRHHLFAIVSSASSAALIAGFPVLMKLTSTDADAAVRVATIFAISLTRSPIMIPLQAFQGVAITAFLRAGGRSLRALATPALGLCLLGIVGAIGAYLLGPWIIALLSGHRYEVAGATLAGLMIAAASLALLTLTGTATIAVSAHLGYSLGWVVASVSAFALLLTPWDLPVRSVVALIVGPLLGVAVHVVTILLSRPPAAATDPAASSA